MLNFFEILQFLWTFSTAVFEARRFVRLTPRRTTLLAQIWQSPNQRAVSNWNFQFETAPFLDKHCFCVHRSYFDFVDMPSLCSARYICLVANSICFRYAQTRYDINPRSRSEHIECLRSKHHIKLVSVYRKSALADLYRCVPALWQVRYSVFFVYDPSLFITQESVEKSIFASSEGRRLCR